MKYFLLQKRFFLFFLLLFLTSSCKSLTYIENNSFLSKKNVSLIEEVDKDNSSKCSEKYSNLNIKKNATKDYYSNISETKISLMNESVNDNYFNDLEIKHWRGNIIKGYYLKKPLIEKFDDGYSSKYGSEYSGSNIKKKNVINDFHSDSSEIKHGKGNTMRDHFRALEKVRQFHPELNKF